MKKYLKHRAGADFALFLLGGFSYGLIEILWRQRTHISMIITGGLCFVIIYRIFKKARDMSLLFKCIIGSAIITTLEFICGCIVNIWLKLSVWDYTNLPFNLLGQICLLYSVLWGFLTIPISFLCKRINAFSQSRLCSQKQKESYCS